MEKTGKKDKKDKKAEKQKKYDDKAAKAFEKKSEQFKSSKSDPAGLLQVLLEDPPFKATDLKLKQDTFMMVMKTFCKLKSGDLGDLVETLGEDKAIDMLKY